ncbi:MULTISPECIES: gephyrin-like molybdotransferase Glp [Microbacterium]|uniref:Molybdopterin molybdenumtransferase n=1 Tax=Microbacterium wangchenii TaxID=2541726 RepID=A0ABX5SU74_9MICO|nr:MULTISPECIES: gephyrin-like molybdotransferase Glp [Microbacterium]MCK6065314.1 molybdopterin molybdotransferase MoeA [Microbacterium sp. EYE_512]QBR88761.1 molybdopterin molybdotransferase MoeA [Microbacterium wangchenii]TFV82185.1 molybdopterin molybdotransferase MoeA [Microbacterium sp. dk485]TXK20485.1 molybdopterin molybdotransferase MoeA [Microbacterium wangchenii]
MVRTVEEQWADVAAAVRMLPSVELPLADAAGRTLAADVTAAVDIPVWENSAMDGFAVRYDDVVAAAADAPVSLRVVADVPAGSDLDPPLRPGEAARIMTGAPVPAAADAIVPFEDTRGGLADSLHTVAVLAAPSARGAHIRRRGEDATRGDVVLPAGVRLGSWQLAAAAAAGVSAVPATRAPRVAVFSTGDELVAPGEPLRRGQIPESNATLLAALVAEADAEVVLRGVVRDDEDEFRAALAAAAERGADVVLTSGGVSAGAFEVVKNTLGDAADIRFSAVAMQPGKPQGFGVLPGGALFFGLPGNPVSVAVSFEVFVRPALLRMQRRSHVHRPVLRVRAAAGWRTPSGRRQYVPVRLDRTDAAGWTTEPATAGGSRSHLAGGLGRAEAFAVVPADVEKVEPGDTVEVMLLT